MLNSTQNGKGVSDSIANLPDLVLTSSNNIPVQDIPSPPSVKIMRETSGGPSVDALCQVAADMLTHGKAKLAADYCSLAIRQQPDPRAYKLLGDSLQQLQSWTEAEQAYRQSLQLDPKQAETYANLGSLYAQQQQWLKALSCYQKTLALKPGLSAIEQNIDRIWQQICQSDDAVKQLYEQFVAQPQQFSASYHLRLGEILLERHQEMQAIVCYRQALQLEPNLATAKQGLEQIARQIQSGSAKVAAVQPARPDALSQSSPIQTQPVQTVSPSATAPATVPTAAVRAVKRSTVASIEPLLSQGAQYMQQQQWQQALSCYEQAVSLHPNHGPAQWQLATVLDHLNQKDRAIEHYFQSLSLDHSSVSATDLCNFGNILKQRQQLDRAVRCYEWAIQKDDQLVEAYSQLGETQYQQVAYESAIDSYRKALKIQRSGQNYHNLGDAFLKLDKWEEAVEAYRRSIDLQPDFSWSYNNLGDALMQLARWEAAVKAYERAIELNPSFSWSYYNLGEALSHIQEWDKAIDAYQQTLHLQPDMATAHRKLSQVLHRRAKADLSTVLKSYLHLIQVDPDDLDCYHGALEIQQSNPDLYVGLANALVRKNQLDQAIVFYQQALRLQPDHAEAVQQLERVTEFKNQVAETIGFAVPSGAYAIWLQENAPKPSDLRGMVETIPQLEYKPLISILVPIYNPPEAFLREMLQSVVNQIYPYWELCLSDDASSQPYVRSVLEEYAAKDTRIKVTFRTTNGHISAASNSALELATGEFVALLDHDDLITPEALYEVVCLLNQHPEADMIYSDEDKLNDRYELVDPFFKPDWCPDSFLSRNYTCHFGVYRRALVHQIGGFRIGYEGSQDYDLVLRLSEQTRNIYHIPKVLYHWRMHSHSTSGAEAAKPYAYDAGARALQDALIRRGEQGRVISNAKFPGVYTVRYDIAEHKLVSIIIPTRNLGDVLDRCLRSIVEKSTYPNYEIILIDNGSDDPTSLAILKRWKTSSSKVRCYRLDIPFNYSRLNNYGVTQAKGEYLLFLNNDTEVITPDWIEAMVEQAQRDTVGAVGAKLLYPDNTIQHAGVIVGLGGVAGHSHKHFAGDDVGYVRQLACVNNYSAVTAACVMCRREVFEKVGGFDEALQVAFNDIDFCLKLTQQSYYNLCLPHVVLYHHESKSRGYEDTPEKQRRFLQEVETMKQRWQPAIVHDPCYSPNLTRDFEDFSLRVKTKIDVLKVDLIEQDNASCWFSLDIPTLGKKAILEVQGWIVGKASAVDMIEILWRGQPIQQIPVNLARPDVAQLFANTLGSSVTVSIEKSGFASIISRIAALKGRHTISLCAVFKDLNKVEFANITFVVE